MKDRQVSRSPESIRGSESACLLLLFFLRITLLAGLAFFLGLHAALMIAFLASGFGLFAAGLFRRANKADAAEDREGRDDCSNRLHVFSFLGRSNVGSRRSLLLTPMILKATQLRGRRRQSRPNYSDSPANDNTKPVPGWQSRFPGPRRSCSMMAGL